MRIPSLLSATLLLAFSLSGPAIPQDLTGGAAPEGTRVLPATTERIDRHRVCREVTNNTSSPIMIPHKSANEWAVGGAAFLSNPYPNVTVAPCAALLTTVYQYGTCLIDEGVGAASPNGCGAAYESVTNWNGQRFQIQQSNMTYNLSDGSCSDLGEFAIAAQSTANPPAYFFHSYRCDQRVAGMPDHFFFGYHQADDASLDAFMDSGTVYVISDPVTVSGLTGDGVMSWNSYSGTTTPVYTTSSNQDTPSMVVRINGGGWLRETSRRYLGDAHGLSVSLRTVRNGDRVEVAIRPASSSNGHRWGTLNIGPASDPSVFLTREFGLYGNRPPPPPPPPPPLTSGGGISTTNENHPVFQLFQACFQVPPGAHLNFPNACTLDASFWADFEAAACAPNPYELSITMGGFAIASNGSACAQVGFDEFISRAKVSTCRPTSCAINEAGPSSCVFRC